MLPIPNYKRSESLRERGKGSKGDEPNKEPHSRPSYSSKFAGWNFLEGSC
jgi:hypothetical protein